MLVRAGEGVLGAYPLAGRLWGDELSWSAWLKWGTKKSEPRLDRSDSSHRRLVGCGWQSEQEHSRLVDGRV